MSTRTGAGRSKHCWGPTARAVCLAGFLLALLCTLVLTGCTSEADLVRTLATEDDATVRQEAAANLAKRHSLASTNDLATAAETDETAAAGLGALADEYGVVLEATVSKAIASKQEELSEKTALSLEETVDCLACMGNPEALDALGTFVLIDGQKVSGVKEVQVRAVAAMGTGWSEEAVDTLLASGSGFGSGSYFKSLQDAVRAELRKIGVPAVEPLMGVAAEEEWARDVLGAMGADAVPALVEALGTQKWAEAALGKIGPEAIEATAAELGSSEENVSHRALGALLRMYDEGKPGIADVMLTEEMIPVLLADLSNEAYEAENAQTKTDGFDHVFAAEWALAEIGEPAIWAVVGSDYEYKWYILEMMGSEAVPSLVAMMTGKDRGNSLESAATLVYMKKSSPEAVSSFTQALENKDLEFIAAHYLYYIALGEAGSDQVIADALMQYGKKQMALDCLNCGNAVLDAAARKWAPKHGYYVYETEKSTSAMPWGIGQD